MEGSEAGGSWIKNPSFVDLWVENPSKFKYFYFFKVFGQNLY